MREGQTLHLQHRDGRPLWSLSDGRSVTADVAAILIRHALVVPADDALFPDLPGQTWRTPMSDKPDLKLIDAAASDDPFDLARLRINPEMLETTSVKKLLTTVPVRKPIAQDFVRVRPEPQYRETLAFIELKDDRETYIVDLGAVPELQGECFFATLFTAISRTGVLFMWPVKDAGCRWPDQRMAHVGRHGCPARDEKLGSRQGQHGPGRL